jgi:hypothetical protein
VFDSRVTATNAEDVVVWFHGFLWLEQSHFLLSGRVIQISASLLEIRFLEFTPDKLTAKAQCSYPLAANTGEWRVNQIAGIAP